ncbi:DNA primase [Candidatus Woesebacteria bacterium]|nr:DNA primase [Candidatus Woesebacteria bacterium]
MSQVQEIKEKLDIIEVVGNRITLERSGKNFRSTCPFHSEKTPSFFVSPELQRFICFGCGRKGDVLSFIQEYDRLTFPETIQTAAEMAGIELNQDWKDPKEQERQKLFAIMELAQKYYSYLLTEHASGKAAREYLKKRSVQSTTIRQFGLGAAPDKWDGLVNYLTKKKNYHPNDVVNAGLAIQGKKGVYDRFRGRVMFPLHDHRGRVVGFSGRVLDPDAKEAKYINTPETDVYHKRYLLFGYWQNLDAIREKESVIVTEGELDVLSSTQAHVRNIVAIKGSALTEEQIRIMARTVKTIYLALDADSAGIKATRRAIELVQPFPVSLRVIPLKGGKDPDELAKSDPKAWREMIKQHTSAFEYVLDTTLAQQDMSTAQGQKTVTNTMLELLLTIDHAVERAFYLKQLAEKLGIPESIIEEQWQATQKKHTQSQLQQHRQPTPDSSEQAEEESGTSDTLGEYLLQILLRLPLPANTRLNPEWITELRLRRILEHLLEWQQDYKSFELAPFTAHLPDELQETVSTLYIADFPVEQKMMDRELRVTLTQLEQRWRKKRLAEISGALGQLENKDELTEAEEQEFLALQKELQRLTTLG